MRSIVWLLYRLYNFILVMLVIYCFFFGFLGFVFILIVDGKNCEILDGKWYNELGLEVYLKYGNDGKLLGEYRIV